MGYLTRGFTITCPDNNDVVSVCVHFDTKKFECEPKCKLQDKCPYYEQLLSEIKTSFPEF